MTLERISDDELDRFSERIRTLASELGASDDAAKAAQKSIERFSRNVGSGVVDVFEDLALKGKSAGDALRDVGLALSRTILSSALAPVGKALGDSVAGLALRVAPTLFFGGPGGASGELAGPVQRFARGGVVSSPAFFATPRGAIGVAGEAGPEAILPLTRGSDGRLGVASTGRAGAGSNVSVTINATDAESFRRSRAQIAAQLARALDRGGRSL